MKIPKEIAEDIFLDETAATIAVCVDRVSFMLDIGEFMELASRFDTARESLTRESAPESTPAKAAKTKIFKDNVVQFSKLLDDDEFH